MARITSPVNERIFNITNWHGVNEAPEGQARLKLGEAAVMRNFCVTSGGALKKRPGSRNVAGLLSQYVIRVREEERQLLITDRGISHGYTMYPRAAVDNVGSITPAGDPDTVTNETARTHKGYYYTAGGRIWALSDCVSVPGAGTEEIAGGRGQPGALRAIASGTETWRQGSGSTYSGTQRVDTSAEAYIQDGAVNVRGAVTPRTAPAGTSVGWETADVGGFILSGGTLYKYYGARVDSYTPRYPWRKYRCNVNTSSYTYYTESGFSSQQTYTMTNDGANVSGTTGYRFNSSNGTFTSTGSRSTLEAGDSGTVYYASGDSCNRYAVSRTDSTHSRVTISVAVARGPYTSYDTGYSRGDLIGTVSLPDSTYPQEDGSYTYVTTFSYSSETYYVMRSGSTYYCYVKDGSAASEYTKTYSFQACPLTVSADTNQWYFNPVYAASNEATDTAVRGIWSGFVGGREVLCAACGGFLWELKEEDGVWTKIPAGNMDTSRDVHMFGFDEKLYILNGEKYREWDGQRLVEVEGYRPLVSVSTVPSGGGTLLESVNRLTPGRRCWFSPDGTATVFQLPETDIASVDWVTDLTATPVVVAEPALPQASDGRLQAQGSLLLSPTGDSPLGSTENAIPAATIPSYTVDLTAGTVTFSTAPAKGVNSIEIAWSAKESYRDQICAMRFAELFNGAQDSRVFLYGDGTNKAFYSGLDYNGKPRADYFPDLYEVSVGDSNTPITAMIRHYNKLIAFKLDSAWSIGYDTITLVDGTVTAGFYVAPVNRSIGNCAYGQAQLVQNRPRTLDGRSVMEWKATSTSGITGDQRNAERVSQRVDNSIRGFDLAKARTFYDKFSHEYYVIGEDGTAIVQNLDVDAWYVYTGLAVTCMINYRDELYYGTRDGFLRHFSDKYFSDNGDPINAVWESGAMSFSEDYRRKYSAMIWIGIKPEDNGYLEVTAQTDRKSDFAVYDVESANAAGVPEMERIKLKAKKFTYYKLILRNNTPDKTATVVSADMRVRGTAVVR